MNIVLIGMSGVGKSLIGKELARELDYRFVDVDDVIEQKTQMKLQDIIDEFGDEKFLEIEERTILDLDEDNCVIAPGGSIVYSERAIEHLKKSSIFVFLDASLESLKSKVKEPEKRGIVYLKRKSYEGLYRERLPLYRMYADITTKIDGLNTEQIIKEIKQSLKDWSKRGNR